MGEVIAQDEVRGFLGRFIKGVAKRGGSSTARAEFLAASIQEFVTDTQTFQAIHGWWQTEAIAQQVVAAPIRAYVSAISREISVAGHGLPRTLQLAGYWTGIGTSYALTPVMPWLAISGASDLFTVSSLLAVQAPFRAYQGTRFVGQGVRNLTTLLRGVAGAPKLRIVRPPLVVRRNLSRIFERLVAHARAGQGSAFDLAQLAREAAAEERSDRAGALLL